MSKKISYFIFVFSLILIFFSVWVIRKYPVVDKPKAYVTDHKAQLNIKTDFELYNIEGKITKSQDFRGKYMLVYFGFSSCPDICPTSFKLIDDLLNNLPKNVSEQLVPIFITVDPERDNIQALKKYTEELNPKIIALTGSRSQIDKAIANYKIYSQKVENTHNPENYMIDHSSLIYLIGKKGEYLNYYSFNNKLIDIEESLIKYVGNNE